jgi:4-oxalocrotonate tautomerase
MKWGSYTSSQPKEAAMPIVTVQQGPRSIEAKRELISRITDAFVDTLKVPAASVQVWIHETPSESWGKGGVLRADASDL